MLLALKEIQESRVLKVILAKWVQRVLWVLKENRGPRVKLAHKVLPVMIMFLLQTINVKSQISFKEISVI